jgi:hypothetical protein
VKIATPLPYWCALGSAQGFEIARAHDLKHGAEDLVVIAAHGRGHMVDQRGSDEEALFVALQRKAAPVDQDLPPSAAQVSIQPSTRALCAAVTTGP